MIKEGFPDNMIFKQKHGQSKGATMLLSEGKDIVAIGINTCKRRRRLVCSRHINDMSVAGMAPGQRRTG